MTKKAFIESYAVWIESSTNKAAFHLNDVERMLDKYSKQQNAEYIEALRGIKGHLNNLRRLVDSQYADPDELFETFDKIEAMKL